MLLLLPAGSLLAQSYDNPSLGQKPISNPPQDYKPLGVRAGSFMLHPGVELALEYTDNVFYSYTDTVSSSVFHLRPYITAQSNWSRHSLTVYLAADIAWYNKYDIQNYEDLFFNVAGTVDVKTRSYFSYGIDYLRLHEGRNVRSAEQGIEPTVYHMTGGYLGYDHLFNRFSVGGLYTLQKLSYENSIALDGSIIDNKYRDRTVNNIGLNFGYQFQADKQAFLRLNWRDTSYKYEPDQNGRFRSGDGYNINFGIAFAITAVLDGDVFASYHHRSFDGPLLPDVKGWAGGAGLHWYPTTLTSVHGRITSSIEDTTEEYASGYLRTLYSVRVDHELLRDLQLTGQVSYNNNNYTLTPDAPAGTRSKDNYWRFGLGVNYFFNRHIRLSASYDYSKLTSNLPRDGFEVNRFWLVLGYER